MRNKLILEIKDLPLRARILDLKELQNVFGGCQTSGSCRDNSDCCWTRACKRSRQWGGEIRYVCK